MIERAQVVQALAEASHTTWLCQKTRDQGVPADELPVEVTDHDLERAEDAVRVLEARGLLGGATVERHWHRAPAPSTHSFADAVPLAATPKGVKAVLEVTAYEEGTKVLVVASTVEGPNHQRTIRQAGQLMFNDADEAKDAIDLIVDRLERTAKTGGGRS